MPGRQTQQAVNDALCRRCQTLEPAIVVRNEPLCRSCFARYVQTKVVKRMESFRVRNSEPGNEQKLLLPLSLDAGSLALLHILSQHLHTQVAKTGRPGYKLCVLHIDDPTSGDETHSSLAAVKNSYPEHEYHTIPRTKILELDNVSALLPQSTHDQSRLGEQETLSQLFSSPRSASSQQDLKRILERRLVVHEAKEYGCRAVLWSYSTTKLAEQILAETAKARGFALPWVINDGESPHGMHFYFPLREVLNKEIDAYLTYLDPPLDGLVVESVKTAVSTKNTTIDDLMGQYFENVEQEYPSIVANVVRTTGKLQPTTLAEAEQQCELCNMPLEGQAPARSRLCYGCIRTLPQAKHAQTCTAGENTSTDHCRCLGVS
ncbi:Cytoplasmic tRNA 2-thiolation protein 2 [Cercospora zeina]